LKSTNRRLGILLSKHIFRKAPNQMHKLPLVAKTTTTLKEKKKKYE
jgi:hypothetical protein